MQKVLFWSMSFFLLLWAQEETAKSCGKCHQTLYEEWAKSTHARAMTSPAFVQMLGDPKDIKLQKENEKNCLPCHSPAPILPKLGIPVLRKAIQSEGVTCITCHQKGKTETMCGPFETPDAPHDWEKHKAFESEAICLPCHTKGSGDAVYFLQDSYFAWKKSKGKNAKTCQECHMPEVERVLSQKGDIQIKRLGRKHTFDGRWMGGAKEATLEPNESLLKKALTLEIQKAPWGVEVQATNSGCGHSFPGMGYVTAELELVAFEGDKEVFRETQILAEWLYGKSDQRLLPEQKKKLDYKTALVLNKVEIYLSMKFQKQRFRFLYATQEFKK